MFAHLLVDRSSLYLSLPLINLLPPLPATYAFLKVNFTPALLMLDLFDTVDDSKSKTIVQPGRLTVVLFKVNPSQKDVILHPSPNCFYLRLNRHGLALGEE